MPCHHCQYGGLKWLLLVLSGAWGELSRWKCAIRVGSNRGHHGLLACVNQVPVGHEWCTYHEAKSVPR